MDFIRAIWPNPEKKICETDFNDVSVKQFEEYCKKIIFTSEINFTLLNWSVGVKLSGNIIIQKSYGKQLNAWLEFGILYIFPVSDSVQSSNVSNTGWLLSGDAILLHFTNIKYSILLSVSIFKCFYRLLTWPKTINDRNT